MNRIESRIESNRIEHLAFVQLLCWRFYHVVRATGIWVIGSCDKSRGGAGAAGPLYCEGRKLPSPAQYPRAGAPLNITRARASKVSGHFHRYLGPGGCKSVQILASIASTRWPKFLDRREIRGPANTTFRGGGALDGVRRPVDHPTHWLVRRG